MRWEEFYTVKIGDKVKLNTELWLGQGPSKPKIILKEGTVFTVNNGLNGFTNYFLYVTDADGKDYKFKIQSLEKYDDTTFA